MAEQSGISWTDATFNPWWGCWPVSPGCALCYADREASRHGYDQLWQKAGPRRTFGEKHWNEPRVWARNLPRKLGRRPRVFCASMADIGEDHPVAEQERPKLFALIEKTPQLDWLLLTKRAETARQWLPSRWLEPGGWPEQAWFLFSAEDQQRFDERLPHVLDIPAPVLGCSYEPALGGIDFRAGLSIAWQCSSCRRYFPDPYQKTCPACLSEHGWSGSHRFNPPGGQRGPGLSWIIAGGESAVPASKARPSHPDWFRSARDQCVAAGVPFHFKQWGEWGRWGPGAGGLIRHISARDGKIGDAPGYVDGERSPRSDTVPVACVGRKAAGRLLDGRTWDEFPESALPYLPAGAELPLVAAGEAP